MSVALASKSATTLPRRAFVAGAGLIFVAAAAAAFTPRRYRYDFSQDGLSQDIPLRFSGWTSSGDADNVVPDPMGNNSPFDHTITRTYDKEHAPQVMLLVTYHGPRSQDLKVHRPEVCYRVAGFSLGDVSTFPMKIPFSSAFNVEAFTATRSSRVEQVMYWTRVGDRFPTDMMDQRLAGFRDGLQGQISDGLLFRLSLLGSDLPTARTILQHFSNELLGSMSSHGRSLLLGSSSKT